MNQKKENLIAIKKEFCHEMELRLKSLYKVYIQNGITYAVQDSPQPKRERKIRELTEMDMYFDELYSEYREKGVYGQKLHNAIGRAIKARYGEGDEFTCFLFRKFREKAELTKNRLNRFRRKAEFNADLFKYFVTITYSDEKFESEEMFRKKWVKFMSNMKCRFKWLFQGGFERGANGERLHWHGLVHIPENDCKGKCTERKQYSTKRHKWETINSCDYIQTRFGNNDFELIRNKIELYKSIKYITKYIGKGGEKFFYNRGIQGETVVDFTSDDFLYVELFSTAIRYRVFDDVNIVEKIQEKNKKRLQVEKLRREERLLREECEMLLSS